MGPKGSNWCPDLERDLHRDTGKGRVTSRRGPGDERGTSTSRVTRRSLQPPRAGGFPRNIRGDRARLTPGLGLVTSRLWENKFALFRTPPEVVCHDGARKQTSPGGHWCQITGLLGSLCRTRPPRVLTCRDEASRASDPHHVSR